MVPNEAWLAGTAGILLLVAAGVANYFHGRSEDRYRHHRRMVSINTQADARRRRDWEHIRSIEIEENISARPLVRDLDVVGQASLLNVCCTAETRQGVDALTNWLICPASIKVIEERQAAVEELATQLEWRQEFQASCRGLAKHQSAVDRLIAFSNQTEPTVPVWVHVCAWLLPVLLFLFVAMWAIPGTAIIGLIGAPLVLAANVVLTAAYAGRFHSVVQGVSPKVTGASSVLLSPAFITLASLPGATQFLADRRRIGDEAATGMRGLERCLWLANLARHPFTAILAYLPLQFIFLWDFHVARLVDRWQQEYTGQVELWFTKLAEVEALASLASLRFDHPDWHFPHVDKTAETLDAKLLGHPLLSDDERIGNDVSVGPTSSVLLITGSNMSGKSTLMRSIGLNALLAQAGGPCCCTKLVMPPVNVLTCMRIADSLERGESLFMAELLRLKEIVETIDNALSDDRLPLYLLDEILSGTNSDERRVAVESVIGHVAKSNAIGAVSTHDLQLARESHVSHLFQHVHFRETFDDESDTPDLQFDYLLREGVATTTNALKLVRMIGLPVD